MKTGTLAFCLFTYAVHVFAQETNLSAVTAAFTKAKIPQDLGFTFNPTVLLDVVYPNVNVVQGQTLEKSEVQTPPSYVISSGVVNNNTPLVVIMVDPDAPSPAAPVLASFRHFVGGDFFASPIAGTSLEQLTNTSAALSEYFIPAPPSVAQHRYVWLVYLQPPGFEEETFFAPGSPINNFNLTAFSAAVGLGNPIGGNFALIGALNI